MEINRKIALIILVGLLAGLFGSFSFLMAMEIVVIKDFAGQSMRLDTTQRMVLRSCKTLKQMTEDTGMQEVSFEGIVPFATRKNLQRLTEILVNEIFIYQVESDQEFIELFQCADYMKAPKKTLAALANRIYEPLRKKIEDTVNEDEKADLEILFETVESHLSYYPNLSSVLKNKKELRKEITGDVGISMSSGQKLGKKLKSLKKFKSLEGIEGLSDQAWTHNVKDLRIEGHEMPKVNFAQIKQAFPAVNHVLLKANELRHISNINASNAAIDLRNNPIELITIDNPRSLKNTRIFVDKDARPVVTFNQSRFDKCAAWFQALGAQGKIALNRLSTRRAAVIGCLAGLGAFAVGMPSICLINKYNGYNESLLSLAKRFTFPEIMGGISLVSGMAVIGSLIDNRNHIRQELAQLVYQDGDHVSVCYTEPYHHGNTRTVKTHSCPSKYAYNLFGKN